MDNVTNDMDFAVLIREKAEAGDPEFLYRVGQCYFLGDNIEKNYNEAKKWYMLAANQENASAQRALGCLFEQEENYKEAVKWYERSAKQGDAIAQNNLAVCYLRGEGVTQDYTEALRLYELSAEQCYWLAFMNLASIYFYGGAVEQDLSRARMYCEKALASVDFSDEPATEEDKREIQDLIEDVSKKLAEAEQKAEAARKTERTEIFVSYAHKDAEYIDEVRAHLKMLENTAKITWWDDKKIQGGEKWDKEIKGAISKAKAVVLFVSANFFASDYIWQEELPRALENGAEILWVLVSSCAYEGTVLAEYQAMADPQKPLAKCNRAERDDVYTAIVRRIKSIYKL